MRVSKYKHLFIFFFLFSVYEAQASMPLDDLLLLLLYILLSMV